MSTVLLVIHLMVAAVLVGLVLLQRSEGGALGIGGGGGGGFMTGRGTANLLTRVTAVVAALFFVTSIMLTILAKQRTQPTSILDEMPAGQTQGPGGGILDGMQPGGEQQEQAPEQQQEPGTPQVPQSQ